jgi:hypothetical protein
LLESTFQGRLHLHLTELPDREIQMFPRLGLLVRVVRKEQLGKFKPGEGDLGRNLSRAAISIASWQRV